MLCMNSTYFKIQLAAVRKMNIYKTSQFRKIAIVYLLNHNVYV